MRTEEKGRLQVLREGWDWCVAQRDSNVFLRQRQNFEARYCVWPYQSADGRKWAAGKGREIFPWPGANDARVPLIDKYIREDAAFLMTVRRRARAMVSGVESNDAAFANRLTQLLRWLTGTQMKEWGTEHRLWASYGLERGAAVMGVFWARERQMGYEEADMESLLVFAQANPDWQPVIELIRNPATEQEAAEMLTMHPTFEEAGVAKLRALVSDLRTTGAGRIALPQVVKDRPKVVALLLNEELFLPPEATDISEEAHWRELLTEAQLRERVGSMGYDEGWVEKMVDTQKGVMTADLGLAAALSRARVTGMSNGLLRTSRLFEVLHSFVRTPDENGVPAVRYTCWNPGVAREEDQRGRRRGMVDGISAGTVAWDGMLDYKHGKLPFVLWEWDKHARLVDEARGYGEIAQTMQRQIKVEWDSRTDRAALATLPPMFHPVGKEPARWGPGARLPQMRPNEYGFVDPPRMDMGSKEVEETARRFADEYFGRPVDEQNVTEARTLKQDLADTWLEQCAEVDAQLLQLCQQFMPDEFFFRVVGSSKGKPIHATREEIQGSFDVMVGYNAENLDSELKQEKLSLMERALAMDVNGIIDRDAALEVAFEMIDPNLGERLLRPGEEATQREVEDEQAVFAKMSSGVPVDVKPGQAYQLRLQTLDQILQGSPIAQERYMKNEDFRKLVDWRRQQLQHQIEQRQNATVGRLGGQSGYDQFQK